MPTTSDNNSTPIAPEVDHFIIRNATATTKKTLEEDIDETMENTRSLCPCAVYGLNFSLCHHQRRRDLPTCAHASGREGQIGKRRVHGDRIGTPL
jgi:hypothetical protein